MDNAFKTALYPGYTTGQLRALAPNAGVKSWDMYAEIGRRERVAMGEVDAMTPGERLIHFSRIRNAA